FVFILAHPPVPTLFPYPTLFRSPSWGPRLASGWRGDQSLGGNATCQKVGLGSRNSTPAFTGSFGNRSMWATTHSSESLVCGFHRDRKSTRLNSSHQIISYAVCCL